jgi:3-hydroxy-3-methylglutaryl CoA synthase
MSFGIEAVEIYFPKTFVDQNDLCNLYITQKNMQESLKASIPRVWAS